MCGGRKEGGRESNYRERERDREIDRYIRTCLGCRRNLSKTRLNKQTGERERVSEGKKDAFLFICLSIYYGQKKIRRNIVLFVNRH